MPAEKHINPFYKVTAGSPQERIVIVSAISCAGFIVFFDQLTKMIIVEFVKLHTRHPVIPGFFDITHVLNTGAAWGIFAGKGWLLLTISVAVFILISCFIKQICEGWTERYYALLMVLAGIMGNSIDRIFRGSVVDFLRFHWNDVYEWPSFNIADMGITVGVGIFILSTLIRPDPDKKKEIKAGSKQ